ncbi:winged helix-turn-helix domain-containing protein [Nocardia sp. NPDC050406]|uniref:winged helix-turn-helix domain-containing protein n=1 Tax=Nocardia sp. NPDC050406 TaxID=3364318 RepID=UPI0037A20E90
MAQESTSRRVLEEIAGRVRGRRSRPPRPSPVITVGDLVVDRLRGRVRRGGILLTLSTREFEVLDTLATRAGGTVDRGEMADHCEGPEEVDEMIARLQRKLGSPRLVQAVGSGYCLRAQGPEP